jgi:hypothetical protein
MTKKNITNQVLKKIKKEKVKPKPKWEFLLKEYVLLGAFGVCVLVGSMASSVMIFSLVNNDWDVYRRFGDNFFTFMMKTMPYFWILILAAFTWIAYYNFKHTKKGYRYKFPVIVATSILISLILGLALFGAKVAHQIDERAMMHLPFYKGQNFDSRVERWSQVEKGVIAGEILEIIEDLIEIENLKGEGWDIQIGKVPLFMKEKLEKGMVVGAMGEVVGENVFEAEMIRPWRGNFLKGPRGGMKMKEKMKELRIK